MCAYAQTALTLDPITVLATKTPETTTDALAGTSSVRQEQLERTMPGSVSDALVGVPGVSFQNRVDDPGTAINIRGLQDFGRVAVTIDGARQNFQRTGHAADGIFYLEPELISGADVVRGPVANIYGSGAIGGVVSFTTKDVDDVLRAGQNYGIVTRGELDSNQFQGVGSSFAAARGKDAEIMVGGVYRAKSNYEDGDGNEIPNTSYHAASSIVKFTLRPADGHTLKFGYIDYLTTFNTGQPFVGTSPPFTGLQVSSIFDTQVRNTIITGRWLYNRPEDKLFDFDGNVYYTRTQTDQTKIDGLPPGFGGIGDIGDMRTFKIGTTGFDVHNNSRFDAGPFRNIITVGADAFQDQVDTNGFGVVFTPSGDRTVSGGFAQLKTNYSTWLEIIGALRYDRYSLSGGGVETDGDRVSPKITVGITPFRGITPYVTYAEGYRAPAVTETLVAGIHPVIFAPFEFLPNPALQPEIGKSKEVGLNFKYDDIFTKGDAFRGKVNAYRNDVDDYIEFVPVAFGSNGQGGVPCTTPGPFACFQYQNITKARLDGFEFETAYDAGAWFAGVSGSHVRGKDVELNVPLAKIPADSITTTLGTRLLDRKLTLAVRWQAVAAKKLSDIPLDSSGDPVFPPTDAYNLINLYASYQFNPDVLATFAVENLFNEQYAVYTSAYPNPTGGGAPIGMPSPGITFKGALKVRFGDDFYKKG